MVKIPRICYTNRSCIDYYVEGVGESRLIPKPNVATGYATAVLTTWIILYLQNWIVM